MSTIAKCPQCQQPVTIPSGMPFDAAVRCPCCQADFPLRVLLAGALSAPAPDDGSAAPELVAVEAAASPESATPATPQQDPIAASAEPVSEPAASEVIVAEVVSLPLGAQAVPGDPLAAASVTHQVAAEPVQPEAVIQAVAVESAAPAEVTQQIADEAPYVPDPAPAWAPQNDGASVAGALMDLWKEAGVAPPLDVPETASAPQPAPDEQAASPAYEYAGAAAADADRPAAPTRSYAARARAEEKVTPKKLVRIAGMIVSGLLAVLVTYGAFKLFGWGTRRKSDPAPAKSEGAAKETFSPDWKGLKPLGGK